MEEQYLPYIVTEIFCIVFSAAILLRPHRDLHQETGMMFLQKMNAAYIVMLATDILATCIQTGMINSMGSFTGITNGISIAAVVMGCYYWFGFVETRLGTFSKLNGRVRLYVEAPALLMSVIDVASSFTGWTFYIDKAGLYNEGKLFWLQSVISLLYLFIPAGHSVFKAFREPLREKRKEYFTYSIYILVPSALLYFVDVYSTVPLFALSIFMIIQILFMTLYIDQEMALAQKEREQTETSTAVMLSQLQPHFLFNALMAIQDKCHGKAPEAEEMVVEFAEYLRGNLDSLRRREPVPFRQELGHTKNYLALENKRFPGKIGVEYYIESEEFLIPSLTLQPVVENAVRYGITQREEGGTVKIYSRDTGSAYQVVVEDDGVGFDINATKPDGRTHIGIDSIRRRLSEMCGGSLEAESTPNVGTKVTITIPKQGGAAV